MEADNKKLMLLDGLSLINRAFYALPVLTTKEGIPTNAIIGFLNIFFKFFEEEKPTHAAVAFDLPAPTFRHKQYTEYKATRKSFPEELSQQIPLVKDILAAMNVTTVGLEGFEADDVMGTLAERAESEGFLTTIISGDRDLLQIASERIKIRIPKTSKGQTTTEDYFAADFTEKMGITPKEYIDVKALMGDSSDNIPGVPGIGEKTALKIIQKYHNIEAAITDAEAVTPKKASENLRNFAEQARLSKELATIITTADVPVRIDDLLLGDIINSSSMTIYRQYELNSLLKKFAGMEAKGGEGAKVAGSADAKPTGRILTPGELSEFIAKIDAGQTACYHLVYEGGKPIGLAVNCDGNNLYMPVNHDSLAEAAAFFEGNIQKVTFDAKKDVRYLRSRGIALKNLTFDLLLAGYLLGKAKDGDDLNDLSLEYLGETMDLTEAGEQLSLLDEPSDNIQNEADAAFAALFVIEKTFPIMKETLEQQELNNVYYDIEMPLLCVLADMESLGVKVDGDFLTEYGKKLTIEIDRLTAEIHTMAGSNFNINSTKQLAKVLFEDMGIKSIKKTKTGYSTDVEVLEKLAVHYEIARKILEYRSYQKLRSTYVDGLLTAIGADGKIHTTFNQAIAATGRLSSMDPNLQNIPVRTELGRELRRAFVASDGFVFVDADYSQIELRVLAELSGDETFLNAFREKQDIHRITAARVFHIPFDEVTDEMRRIAKAVNFGIVYGISAFSLADDIKVSNKEAESFIEGYFQRYPSVKKYMDKTVAQAKEDGYAKTIFGRRRLIPELSHKAFNTRSFGERAAMNMPVQGTAADIIKIAMIKVWNRLAKEGLKSRLVLQVHDELLIEAKIGEEERVKAILKDEMENAVSLSVPLAIDISEGKSWYDAK